MQNLENDVIKKLLKSEYLNRLNDVLNCGFFCTPEDIKQIKTVVSKHIDPETRMALAYDFFLALGLNTKINSLRSLAQNEAYSDVIVMCNNKPLTVFIPNEPVPQMDFILEDSAESKKRKNEALLTVVKKTKH